MSINRKELKQQAREAMRQAKPRPYWIALLYFVIIAVLGVLSTTISGDWEAYQKMFDAAMSGAVPSVPTAGNNSFIGGVLSLALEVMSIELGVGFTIYTLRVWRRMKAGAGDLFDSFGIFFRALWINILVSFIIGLWVLLYSLPVGVLMGVTVAAGNVEIAPWILVLGLPLLIPMWVASYAYRQSVFIMLDNPQLTCLQCVMLSKRMMKGYKWKLFVLDLSFIGWIILSIIPFVAFWVIPYMEITCAGYYDRLTQQYAIENAPPVQPEPPAV